MLASLRAAEALKPVLASLRAGEGPRCPESAPILGARRRLLGAEQKLGYHEQRNADIARSGVAQMGQHALVPVEQARDDVRVEDVLSRQAGDGAIRALANVGKQRVQLRAGLTFPATDLTKSVGRGLLRRLGGSHGAHFDSQLVVDLYEHRARGVALERPDRLVEWKG